MTGPGYRLRDNSVDFIARLYSGTNQIHSSFLYDNGSYGEYWNNYQGNFIYNNDTCDLEWFEDYVHVKDRKTHRYPVGPCRHVKVVLPVFPQASAYHSDVYHGTRNWLPDSSGKTPFMPVYKYGIMTACRYYHDNAWESVSAPTKAELDNLALEAFNYFSTVFPTELPVGEFAQNFTQLRELLPEIKDSVLSTLSGGYLTKEFGWDNLLSDLGNLSELIDSIKDRMEYLKKTYGIPQRMGFHRGNIHQLPNAVETYGWSEWAFFDVRAKVILASFDISFRATAWITQTLDFIDDVLGWLRALAMSFGLDNPLLAFWQVVPFSFVVDWFLNISGHLERVARIQPAVGWSVDSFTTSVTRSETWRLQGTSGYGTASENVVQETEMTVTEYTRNTGLSLDLGLLPPGELSQQQLILLAALGLA